MDNLISVIIVDDHPLVLSGFEYILKDHPLILLKGSFTSAVHAMDFLEKTSIDVVLMDINLPDLHGIEATEIIKKRYPLIKVIAISNLNEAGVAGRMLSAGATGYLLKNVSAEELINAIQAVHLGESVISTEMESIIQDTPAHIPFVTRRELEVLALMAEGLTTPEIAERLFISKLTVESHRRNLLQKFKVNNAVSLIRQATEMKFI